MKTLICVRQLPYAETTLQFGGVLARLEESEVTLMTVVAQESDAGAAEAELKQASKLLNGLDVNCIVRIGQPVREIVVESGADKYDLVTVGSHDVLGFLEALFGSVTGKVADKAFSSVLVVRDNEPSLRKILMPIGGQTMNPDVVRSGARLAKRAAASVTLLHITNPVPSMYTGLTAIDESLDELLQTDTPVARHLRWAAEYLDQNGVDAELKLARGVASDGILREARQGGYDLLVIGAPALTGGPLRSLVIDKVTPNVVDRAQCSVLVVR